MNNNRRVNVHADSLIKVGQDPAGEIVLNQEGITLIGNVYVEGPLTEDAGAADGVSPFETQPNGSQPVDIQDLIIS